MGPNSLLGHRLQTGGFARLSAAWALLFVDRLLVPLLDGICFAVLVGVLALGGALVVLGSVGDARRLEEVVPTGRVAKR